MPSSKKKRGKQRKAAAARQRQPVANPQPNNLPDPSQRFADPRAAIDGIRRGEAAATEYVAYEICNYSGSERETWARVGYLDALLQDGLLRTVLDFLSQCRHASVGEVRVGERLIGEVAFDPITEPGHWLGLLVNITREGGLLTKDRLEQCQMELARGIGPLVNCMSSDAREFFRNDRLWHNAVYPFLHLVRFITAGANGQTAMQILLESNEKELLRLLVQFMFWKHHPDIAEIWKHFGRLDRLKEVAAEAERVLERAMAIDVKRVLATGHIDFDERAKRRLRRIGMTPIGATSVYSSRETIPLTIAMVGLLRSIDGCTSKPLNMLKMLVNAGSVDKVVIAGVIDSVKKVSTHERSAEIIQIMVGMLIPHVGEGPLPTDNRFAYAIDKGLLEVCVKLLVRFGDRSSPFDDLQCLLNGAYGASIMMKSSKALVRQRGQVIGAVQRAEAALEKSSASCRQLLRSVKVIALLKDGIEEYTKKICCYCAEYLASDEIKKCTRCKEHESLVSLEGKTNGDLAEEKVERGERAIGQNARAAVDKLMNESHLCLLAQATLQGYDILDCVAFVDLVDFPTLSVQLAADFIESLDSSEERTILRDIIDCNKAEGYLTSYVQFHSVAKRGTKNDRHKHPNSSWQDAQAVFREKEWTMFDETTVSTNEAEETFGAFFCDWFDRKWAADQARPNLSKATTEERTRLINELAASNPSFEHGMLRAVAEHCDEVRSSGGQVNPLTVWHAANDYLEKAAKEQEEKRRAKRRADEEA